MKGKQNRASESPKLENARKLLGIDFIGPEDKEFTEIIKNARKKLEVPTAPVMPCKRTHSRHGATRSKNDDHKSKFACILEKEESKRLRMQRIAPKIHEDHIAGKGSNSQHHYFLVHIFIPMLQAMKIPAVKAAVDKEWERLEKISAWNLAKARNKSEVTDEARNKSVTVHFCIIDGSQSSEKC